MAIRRRIDPYCANLLEKKGLHFRSDVDFVKLFLAFFSVAFVFLLSLQCANAYKTACLSWYPLCCWCASVSLSRFRQLYGLECVCVRLHTGHNLNKINDREIVKQNLFINEMKWNDNKRIRLKQFLRMDRDFCSLFCYSNKIRFLRQQKFTNYTLCRCFNKELFHSMENEREKQTWTKKAAVIYSNIYVCWLGVSLCVCALRMNVYSVRACVCAFHFSIVTKLHVLESRIYDIFEIIFDQFTQQITNKKIHSLAFISELTHSFDKKKNIKKTEGSTK